MSGKFIPDAWRTDTGEHLLLDPRLLTLVAVSFVGMFNATVVSPALPTIVQAFDVPDAQIGLVMSLYTLPGIVFVVLFGALADIYGRKVVLLSSLLLVGVAGVLIAISNSFTELLLFRIVQGIGGAAIMPLIAVTIGDLYEGPTASTAHGLRASVNGASMLIMPVLVGFLVGVSWRFAFLLYAAALVISVLSYLVLPNVSQPATDGRSLNSIFSSYFRTTTSEMRSGTKGILLLGALVRGFTIFAILTFIPLFAVWSLGAIAAVVGGIIAMRGIARLIIAPFIGLFLSSYSYRSMLSVSLIVSAIGAALVPVIPGVLGLALLMGLYSVGDSLFFPIHQDALTRAASTEDRAGLLSTASFLRKIGTTVSPVLLGLLLPFVGFTFVFLLTALVLVSYSGLLVLYGGAID